MAIENVYSYLEYLALTVDQLADAVIEREEETAVLEARIQELTESLIAAQSLSETRLQSLMDQADARVQLAEARAMKAEEKAEELSLMLKSAKQNKRKVDPQIDLFAAPFAESPPQESLGTKSHKVANDENALILAKKLDSTIDKVQKLIREARA